MNLRRRLGLRPIVVPYVGYGTGSLVRVTARVRLSRGLEAPNDDPNIGTWATTRAHLRRWFTLEVAGMPVDVEIGGKRISAATDAEGYISVVVSVELEPGWHDVVFYLDDPMGQDRAVGQLLVPDPHASFGIVSDVDDTIIHTGLTRGWEMVRTSMARVEEREALPGAAELYRTMTGVGTTAVEQPMFYLSTSPWNLYDVLQDFLKLHDFPVGPMFLTDWEWRGMRLFRPASRDHKTAILRQICADFPELDVVLIGDSGQEDPEIYADFARTHHHRVRAIYIRDAAPLSLGRADEVRQIAHDLRLDTERHGESGVPMLLVKDSSDIEAHAVALGILAS